MFLLITGNIAANGFVDLQKCKHWYIMFYYHVFLKVHLSSSLKNLKQVQSS